MLDSKFARVAAMAAVVLLAACGGDADDAPAAADAPAEATATPAPEAVVVYSSRGEQLISPIFEAFTQSTGITVEFVTDDPQPLIARLRAEGANTPASVLLTVDAGNLWFAAEQGVLASTASEALETAIPEYLRDPDGRWFGLSLRARTIVYDSRELSADDLVSYEDLADPKWKGRLCLRTSKKVYNQSLVALMIARHGEERTEEIVRGWVDNLAMDPTSNDTRLLEAIADGRCDVGVVNTYYLGRLQRDNAELPVGLYFPAAEVGGVHVNVSGAGIVANAANPEGAQQLLEWLAGTGGQALFAGLNYEFPILAGTENDPIVEAWGPYSPSDQPLVDAGRLQADAVRLMDRAGYR
ncbi:MAG: extracellular solute-binding protein [Pseudomonadota bacterium]